MALEERYRTYSNGNGVVNLPGLLGLGEAIRFPGAVGMAQVEGHNLQLRNALADHLRALDGLTLVSPPAGALAGEQDAQARVHHRSAVVSTSQSQMASDSSGTVELTRAPLRTNARSSICVKRNAATSARAMEGKPRSERRAATRHCPVAGRLTNPVG